MALAIYQNVFNCNGLLSVDALLPNEKQAGTAAIVMLFWNISPSRNITCVALQT